MRRLALAVAGSLVLWLSSTGVALAACCELAYLEVQAGGEKPLRVDAAELEQSLGTADFELLYWPAANGSSKAAGRPPGDLGPAYEVEYVLHDVTGRPTVEIRETVYPEAPGGPAAVAASGQTAAFEPGEPEPVPAGWRPFPERAARELDAILKSGKEASGPASSRAPWLALVAAAGAAAAAWFTIHRPSSVRDALRIS